MRKVFYSSRHPIFEICCICHYVGTTSPFPTTFPGYGGNILELLSRLYIYLQDRIRKIDQPCTDIYYPIRHYSVWPNRIITNRTITILLTTVSDSRNIHVARMNATGNKIGY